MNRYTIALTISAICFANQPLRLVEVSRTGLPPYMSDKIYIVQGDGVERLKHGDRLVLWRPEKGFPSGTLVVDRLEGIAAIATLDKAMNADNAVFPLKGDLALAPGITPTEIVKEITPSHSIPAPSPASASIPISRPQPISPLVSPLLSAPSGTKVSPSVQAPSPVVDSIPVPKAKPQPVVPAAAGTATSTPLVISHPVDASTLIPPTVPVPKKQPIVPAVAGAAPSIPPKNFSSADAPSPVVDSIPAPKPQSIAQPVAASVPLAASSGKEYPVSIPAQVPITPSVPVTKAQSALLAAASPVISAPPVSAKISPPSVPTPAMVPPPPTVSVLKPQPIIPAVATPIISTPPKVSPPSVSRPVSLLPSVPIPMPQPVVPASTNPVLSTPLKVSPPSNPAPIPLSPKILDPKVQPTTNPVPEVASPASQSETTIQALKKSAEAGDLKAQTELGILMSLGKGIQKNDAEAAMWYQKAADQGSTIAQGNLGLSYALGQGVPQDYGKAVKWLRKSADQGNAMAQFNLGICYDEGNGVPQDHAEAIKWYLKAAEQGNVQAQTNLGYAYEHGKGVPQNSVQAVKWYQKAAEQGAAQAQYNLGAIFANGQGVQQNIAEAVKWLEKAADQGDRNAIDNLKKLKTMPKSNIEKSTQAESYRGSISGIDIGYCTDALKTWQDQELRSGIWANDLNLMYRYFNEYIKQVPIMFGLASGYRASQKPIVNEINALISKYPKWSQISFDEFPSVRDLFVKAVKENPNNRSISTCNEIYSGIGNAINTINSNSKDAISLLKDIHNFADYLGINKITSAETYQLTKIFGNRPTNANIDGQQGARSSVLAAFWQKNGSVIDNIRTGYENMIHEQERVQAETLAKRNKVTQEEQAKQEAKEKEAQLEANRKANAPIIQSLLQSAKTITNPLQKVELYIKVLDLDGSNQSSQEGIRKIIRETKNWSNLNDCFHAVQKHYAPRGVELFISSEELHRIYQDHLPEAKTEFVEAGIHFLNAKNTVNTMTQQAKYSSNPTAAFQMASKYANEVVAPAMERFRISMYDLGVANGGTGVDPRLVMQNLGRMGGFYPSAILQ